MIVSNLPAAVLAANYDASSDVSQEDLKIGDTFTADSREAALPEAPEGLEWDCPKSSYSYTCGKTQHSHSEWGNNSCYSYEIDKEGIVVDAGDIVTVYGKDIVLVAQWAAAVSYVYEGVVPAGAPDEPATKHYDEGVVVKVEEIPEVEGYKFIGWETEDVTVEGSTFEMPNDPVVFTGKFEKAEDQTKTLSYTVEYYFNHEKNPDIQEDIAVSEEVWVGDDDYLPVDRAKLIKTFEGWEYGGSIPAVLPTAAEDGSVIKLYYHGTEAVIDVIKQVDNLNDDEDASDTVEAKIGAELKFTITVSNNGNTKAENIVIYDTLNGYGQIEFTDTDNIKHTRGTYETLARATMVNRIMEREVEADDMLDDMIFWPDNLPEAWYYEAVQEATNSHTYKRTNKKVPNLDFYYEEWKKLIENPDWAALERIWSDANS